MMTPTPEERFRAAQARAQQQPRDPELDRRHAQRDRLLRLRLEARRQCPPSSTSAPNRPELDEAARRGMAAYCLANCGVPAMYREAAAWSQEQLAYLTALWDTLTKSPAAIVLLCGNPGTGKTHMACEIVMQWAAAGITARYATAEDMLNEIKTGFDVPGSRSSIVRKFEAPKLLILDEFFRRRNDDWDSREMWRLLDRRYSEKRATVIISNDTAKALEPRFDPPMWGRIQQFGGAMEVGGKNWRMA